MACGQYCPDRVHGLAGLDIGVEAPELIALAIVAEIQAMGAHRPGGSLKLRTGPLHEDPQDATAPLHQLL